MNFELGTRVDAGKIKMDSKPKGPGQGKRKTRKSREVSQNAVITDVSKVWSTIPPHECFARAVS